MCSRPGRATDRVSVPVGFLAPPARIELSIQQGQGRAPLPTSFQSASAPSTGELVRAARASNPAGFLPTRLDQSAGLLVRAEYAACSPLRKVPGQAQLHLHSRPRLSRSGYGPGRRPRKGCRDELGLAARSEARRSALLSDRVASLACDLTERRPCRRASAHWIAVTLRILAKRYSCAQMAALHSSPTAGSGPGHVTPACDP